MRAAAILGLGCSEKDLQPFRKDANTEWTIGLPRTASDADAILVFGGDGTVHRHLSVLVKLGLPVLVVARGSGNDFARALGLRTVGDSLRAWRNFASGGPSLRAIDLGIIAPLGSERADPAPQGLKPSLDRTAIGTAEAVPFPVRSGLTSMSGSKYFCCVGGVGLDAEVARRANQLPRWLRRRGGYVLSLPPALTRFSPVAMKISTFQPDANLAVRSTAPLMLAAFANASHYGGGMAIAPRARLDDGLLEVCLVGSLSRLKLLRLFPSVYFGHHLRHKPVEYFQAARLRIETGKPVDVYADGEYVCQTPIEVSAAKQALRVIAWPGSACTIC